MHISDYFKYDFLFDSHAHLNSHDFKGEEQKIVENALNNEVKLILDASTSLDSAEKSLELSRTFPDSVKSFIGIDPENFIPGSSLYIGDIKAESWFEEHHSKLKNLIEANREFVIGIGETGLDEYWLKEVDIVNTEESRKSQEKMFRIHLQLAEELNLPLTVHTRGVEAKCAQIIQEYPKARGIFHSFTGDYETAKKVLDSGWGLGVNGIITFKNAQALREMYKKLVGKSSSDWRAEDWYKKGIFFETDAPYLAPDGKRGQRNEPANVRDVYDSFVMLMTQD